MSRVRGQRFFLCACLWMLAGVPQAAAQDPPPEASEFKVVVNAANPLSELEAKQATKMFLRKIKRWAHSESVSPVDLGGDSPVRKAFTRAVHGKSVTAVKSFWQRMIFSGRAVPPEERAETEVLSYVGSKAGAIGYVGSGTELPDGVKELKITY